ncbi:MAG: tRNA (guanine(10)-N(2))-dimethyltransferase [Hadesarchaea archaeon]|nr:tRNA (guanine(10)-N(2))-dimethyltransferase [Hadesarchaea archaeon]
MIMETQIITEGKTKLEVSKLEDYQTSPNEYVPSLTPVFFNPLMELSRDISVASTQILSQELREPQVCDALAGVGARGIRYGNEINEINKIIVNDKSPQAVKLIQKNIQHNNLQNATATNEDANKLLQSHENSIQIIDLDPFGSPAPFLNSACSALSRNSALLVTATDTAPLCGAHPKACERKYGARSLRTPYCHELGLRILIGSCQRIGARRDIALTPVFSHSTQHFFRTHLKAEEGAKKANSILKKQGYVSHCFNCGNREINSGPFPILPKKCKCGKEYQHSGPMWIGRILEEKFVKKTKEEITKRNFSKNSEAQKLLNLCLKEANGPPTFYDLHKISGLTGTSPPKLNRVLKKLKKKNYFASRTHFLETGIRTDASAEELKKIISKNK